VGPQIAPKKNFSRKKVLLLVGLVLIFLLGLGAVVFRLYSHQEFEKFAQKLEGFSQQELSILLATDKLEKQLHDEFDAIIFKETGNLAENKKHLAKVEKINAEMYKKQTDEYLPLVEREITDVSQFLSRRRYLWLWGKEKEFLNIINSVSEAATKAKDADAIILEREKLIAEVSFTIQGDTIVYLGFVKDLDRLVTSTSATTKALAPLKKYTTGYKFPGEDQLKTLYPSFYKALANYKTLYDKTYEMFVAYAGGNYTKAYQLSAEVTSISKRSFDMAIDWDPLNRPFFQAELDAHVDGLSAVNLYKENKLGKVSFGSRRLAGLALVWASQLYALDHKDNYPQATNVDSAIKIFTEGKYLPTDFHFDQTTFSFSSSKTKYHLSFTDEITGEVASFTLID